MGMPPIPTGVFKIGTELSTAESGTSGATANLGVDRFTVIFFCPALSMYYGSGTVGRVPSSEKLSGFTIQIANNPLQ